MAQIKIRKKATHWGEGVTLFSIMRNEEHILPYFFEYYKEIGVNNFVIYNDSSTDRTEEILASHKNCTILASEHKFGDTLGITHNHIPFRFGPFLKTQIPMKISPTGWVLVVDADEFLILPPQYQSITSLLGYLDDIAQPYLSASLVDFYPEILSTRNSNPSSNPFHTSTYFDIGPYFEWDENKIEPRQLSKGIRARLLRMLAKDYPNLVIDVYGNNQGYLARTWKIPLLKNGQGVHLLDDHVINIHPNSNLKGALAHFKFTENLDQKITYALATNSYFGNSMEYHFLEKILQKYNSISLIDENSRLFTGSQSLVDSFLM